MVRYTLHKLVLMCLVITFFSVFSGKRNAQADLIVIGPSPATFIENVSFYDGDDKVGLDELMPEVLSYGRSYDYHDTIYGIQYTVNQSGHVTTELDDVPFSDKKVPVIHIKDTTSATCQGGSLDTRGGRKRAAGYIEFQAQVINKGEISRNVPLRIKGDIDITIGTSGNARGAVKMMVHWFEVDNEWHYKTGGLIWNHSMLFCKASGSEIKYCTQPSTYLDPGAYPYNTNYSVPIPSGQRKNFIITMFVFQAPHVVVSDSNPSATVNTEVELDPYFYIDPQWEYAHEFEILMSDGLYAGPPIPLSHPSSNIMLYMPAILGNKKNNK